jgi:hypothetical protein
MFERVRFVFSSVGGESEMGIDDMKRARFMAIVPKIEKKWKESASSDFIDLKFKLFFGVGVRKTDMELIWRLRSESEQEFDTPDAVRANHMLRQTEFEDPRDDWRRFIMPASIRVIEERLSNLSEAFLAPRPRKTADRFANGISDLVSEGPVPPSSPTQMKAVVTFGRHAVDASPPPAHRDLSDVEVAEYIEEQESEEEAYEEDFDEGIVNIFLTLQFTGDYKTDDETERWRSALGWVTVKCDVSTSDDTIQGINPVKIWKQKAMNGQWIKPTGVKYQWEKIKRIAAERIKNKGRKLTSPKTDEELSGHSHFRTHCERCTRLGDHCARYT